MGHSFNNFFLSERAFAQLQIKVNDTTNIQFGVLVQGQADWTQDTTDNKYAQNLFLRRMRLMVGGQIVPNLTFFYETDNPNLGKAIPGTTKTISSGLITQDAFLTWKIADPLAFDACLMFIPLCRNCLQSAAATQTELRADGPQRFR